MARNHLVLTWLLGVFAGHCFLTHTFAEGTDMDTEFTGFRVTAADTATLDQLPGPLPHTTGLQAVAASGASIGLQAGIDVSERGMFSLWVHIDQRYHGRVDPQIEFYRETLVDGSIQLEVTSYDDMLQFAFSGHGPGISFVLPSAPGPGWYHLAFVWDAEKGQRDAFLNGTRVRPMPPARAWEAPRLERLKLYPHRFAVSGVRLQAGTPTMHDLRTMVTSTYWGAADHLLGAREPAPFVIDAMKGALVHENPLARKDDTSDWVMEGPGVPSFEDGWMRLYSSMAGQGGHFVYWCPIATPEDYIVEWDFQVLNPHLAIIFFSATAPDNLSLFDPSLRPREGVFTRYLRGEIDAYHISYFSPNRISVNLRKNHGFFLPAVGPHWIDPDSTDVHRIQLMNNGGHIQLAIDGRVAIDFFDNGQTYGPAFAGGHIAFRQMQHLDARYRNLRIYEVAEAHRPAPADRPPVGRMPRPEEMPPASVINRLGPGPALTARFPLPAEDWAFQLDPERVGRDAGWYRPDWDESEWGKIRTGMPWQEAGHAYVGVAWYRRVVEFPAVEKPDAAAAVLDFQGVDESAWVWVNGHFVGAHDLGSVGWDRPFSLDISEHIRWDAPNHIAVQAMNTAGLGGIYEPITLLIYHKAGDAEAADSVPGK